MGIVCPKCRKSENLTITDEFVECSCGKYKEVLEWCPYTEMRRDKAFRTCGFSFHKVDEICGMKLIFESCSEYIKARLYEKYKKGEIKL